MPAAGRAVRVVVIEDNDDLRWIIGRVLRHDGRFDVVGAATTAAEAVSICAEQSPDAVVLDLALPDEEGGVGTLQRIHHDCPDSRIVVYSAYVEKVGRSALLDSGAAAVVSKAESIEDVASLLLPASSSL